MIRAYSSDFWALGCIIYQMIAGRFVFRGLADWQKIKQLEYDFPEGFDEQAQDLVRKLLVRPPFMALYRRQHISDLRGFSSAGPRPRSAIRCRAIRQSVRHEGAPQSSVLCINQLAEFVVRPCASA